VALLVETLESLSYEDFTPAGRIDDQKRFQLQLDPAFPLTVLPYSIDPSSLPHPLNCHRALELVIPVEGRGIFQMGDRMLTAAPGELIVVDNAKLHGFSQMEGHRMRGVAVLFAAELVGRPGAAHGDPDFLAAFQGAFRDPIRLSAGRSRECELSAALSKLLSRWADPNVDRPRWRLGCAAYLLEVLYLLSQRLGKGWNTPVECERRRRQEEFLWRFHEHVSSRIGGRISVNDAAAFAGMGRFAFMRYFREITGTTFGTYIMQLRIDLATRLLFETDEPISQVAAAAGFCDQSYMDRVFRRHYGNTPRSLRLAAKGRSGETAQRVRKSQAGAFLDAEGGRP
jgi:AraC-like DNA-binding protein